MATSMERRSFLKGLIGLPLALMAGGVLINDAGVVEAQEDQALFVPKPGLLEVTQPQVLQEMALSQGYVGQGGILRWVAAPGEEIHVPTGTSLWIRLVGGPRKVMEYSIWRDMKDGVRVQAVGTRTA